MPEENKPESENKEQTLNEVAEELKKVGNVITDGINKLEEKTESNNLELKNLSSSITEVKESVNHISLTTDSNSEIQTQQIESLNSLVEETKQNREEIKGAIDKQTKEQSKISKKQMKLMTATNTELKATNKGFKKLSKSIDDLDIGGGSGGGGGGGLLGLIMGVLGSITSVIAPFIATLLPLLAAASIPSLLYKFLVEPMLDEAQKRKEKVQAQAQFTSEELKTDKGETVFSVPNIDKEGRETVTQMTKSELEQEVSKPDITPERKEQLTSMLKNEKSFSVKILKSAQTNQPASQKDSELSKLQGSSIEEIRRTLDNKEKTEKQDPQKTEVLKLSYDIKAFEEEIYSAVKEINDEFKLKFEVTGVGDITGAEHYDQLKDVNAKDTVFKQKYWLRLDSLIQRIKKSRILTDENKEQLLNSSELIKDFSSGGLFSNMENKWNMSWQEWTYPGVFFDQMRYSEVKEDKKSNWSKPAIKPIPVSKEIYSNKDNLVSPLPRQTEKIEENNKPKANNGAILTGPQKGYNVELHGTEAVINPKSPQGDQVTGAIAKNLVEEITDVKSIPKESIMIQDGLSRSKNEHYDMTVAQPLSSSGQGTSVVNNIVGGGTSDSRRDPNSQFNPSMLLLNNTETVSQQVLMEIKKAELL